MRQRARGSASARQLHGWPRRGHSITSGRPSSRHLAVFARMSAPTGQKAPRPEGAWPDNTYTTLEKRLYFTMNPWWSCIRPANADGNSIVLFRKSDVVSAGDCST